MDQRPLPVAAGRPQRHQVAIVAPVGRRAEVEPCVVTQLRREDQPAVNAGRIVGILAEILDIVGEDARLRHEVAAGQRRRQPDPSFEVERVGEGGALDERGEARAGQLFQGLEIVVLADRQADRVGRLVGEDGVGDLDIVVGEIDLEHIAEAARNRAFDAEPAAAQLIGETQAGIADAVGAGDIAEIILQPAARLERPSARRGDLRRAAEANLRTGLGRRLGRCRRLHIGHRCQLKLRRLKGGGPLRLELCNLGAQCRDLGAQRGDLGGKRGVGILAAFLGLCGNGAGERGGRQQPEMVFPDHSSPTRRMTRRRAAAP